MDERIQMISKQYNLYPDICMLLSEHLWLAEWKDNISKVHKQMEEEIEHINTDFNVNMGFDIDDHIYIYRKKDRGCSYWICNNFKWGDHLCCTTYIECFTFKDGNYLKQSHHREIFINSRLWRYGSGEYAILTNVLSIDIK